MRAKLFYLVNLLIILIKKLLLGKLQSISFIINNLALMVKINSLALCYLQG